MAKVFFDNIKNLGRNKLVVPVHLDTNGENINTFEVRLKVKNLIFRDYFEKDSLVTFWIEKPKIENDILTFSGVIPGGYIGKKGPLVQLVFERQGKGYLEVLSSSQFLLNDGRGTKTKTDAYSIVLSEPPMYNSLEIADRYPPERFTIYLDKDFNGRYFLIFEAKDKQSGIAYYEVLENQFFLQGSIKDVSFERVTSPYTLRDQTLRSYVFVKAVDKFGNERIEVLKPKNIISGDELYFLIVFILLFYLILLKWSKIFFIRDKKSNDL